MEGRKLNVYAHLEHVVNLRDKSLHGYWVLTRVFSGEWELSFKDIVNMETKKLNLALTLGIDLETIFVGALE